MVSLEECGIILSFAFVNRPITLEMKIGQLYGPVKYVFQLQGAEGILYMPSVAKFFGA